jgi:N-acetylglucosamine-6-phosphate deacetylase
VARYFDGARLRAGDVEVADGVVSAVGLAPGASGIAAPGWLDVQVNGFAGVDVLHAGEADLHRMAAAVVATGVTSLLATVITAPEADARAAVAAVDAVRRAPRPGEARILGAHLEGPFLSPDFPGAHPRALLRDDPDGLCALGALDGVAMVTLAPEVFASDDVIADLVAAGRVVSIGHSAATAARSAGAFKHGAAALTHAFNAHRLFASREPGPLGAALADRRAVVSVVADGVSVARENLILLGRVVPGRLMLVTDAMVAAGLGDGAYRFGSLDVTVSGGRVTLADGTLAGSVGTMDRCVRHAAGLWGVEAALAAASASPAALIGRPDLGRLEVGAPADIVRLTDDLEVTETLLAGFSGAG